MLQSLRIKGVAIIYHGSRPTTFVEPFKSLQIKQTLQNKNKTKLKQNNIKGEQNQTKQNETKQNKKQVNTKENKTKNNEFPLPEVKHTK